MAARGLLTAMMGIIEGSYPVLGGILKGNSTNFHKTPIFGFDFPDLCFKPPHAHTIFIKHLGIIVQPSEWARVQTELWRRWASRFRALLVIPEPVWRILYPLAINAQHYLWEKGGASLRKQACVRALCGVMQ